MYCLQVVTLPPHPRLPPGSSAGFAPFVLDYPLIYLTNKSLLPLPCPPWIPGTKRFSSPSFATRRIHPIAAAILTLFLLTAPVMSIIPTESSSLLPTLPPRVPAPRTQIACPIFDHLILHPPTTLALTPHPLDLTPTQTTPPIRGILLTRTTTRPTTASAPCRVPAPTAPFSTVPLLPRPLVRLLKPNLAPRVCQEGAQSL